MWQEQFVEDQIVYNSHVNLLGAKLVPVLNRFFNEFNSFSYYELEFQVGLPLYFITNFQVMNRESFTGWQRGVPWGFLVPA